MCHFCDCSIQIVLCHPSSPYPFGVGGEFVPDLGSTDLSFTTYARSSHLSLHSYVCIVEALLLKLHFHLSISLAFFITLAPYPDPVLCLYCFLSLCYDWWVSYECAWVLFDSSNVTVSSLIHRYILQDFSEIRLLEDVAVPPTTIHYIDPCRRLFPKTSLRTQTFLWGISMTIAILWGHLVFR
jgi:hypothetical protein